MRNTLLILLLFYSFFIFSQDKSVTDFKEIKKTIDEVFDRGNDKIFKGFSLGLLVQGQTKYPTPYFGPEVSGLYNNGAYHYVVDFYIKNFLVGFQLTDEYFYIENIESSGAVWKPRGYNGSYSSLTRAYWISLGYNVFNDLNLKFSVGFRNGPTKSILMSDKNPSEISQGFNYDNPSIFFNQSVNSIDKYSEVDYSLSVNYPIRLYKNFKLVPELGYSFKYAGIMAGVSVQFLNQ